MLAYMSGGIYASLWGFHPQNMPASPPQGATYTLGDWSLETQPDTPAEHAAFKLGNVRHIYCSSHTQLDSPHTC